MKSKLRLDLWPTVITLICFSTCVALGIWQVKRLFWKEDLITKVETRISSAAIEVPKTNQELIDNEFQRVHISGKLLLDKVMQFGIYYENEWGVKLVAPMKLDDGRIIFVNFGWVPEKKRADEFWKKNVSSEINLDGVIRIGQTAKLFSPKNDTVKNYWFWYDIPEMKKFTGYNDAEEAVIEVVDHEWPNKRPVVPTTKIEFKNDHLQYAITWFLLAIGIAAIYFVDAYKRAKETAA